MSLRKVSNPPNPFHQYSMEWLDVPPPKKLEIYEEQARSIISENKSPDLGFRFSVNPYRGCFHACAYCYARPSHQYLDFGAGSDFERKIVVKKNAAQLLKKAFMKPSWKGDLIVFSGNTDCYQPLEASYKLTRQCLEVCAAFRNPVALITKGALVERDIDLLQELSRTARVHVMISAAFADDKVSKALEPNAPRPSTRFRAMKALSDAGISTGLALSPLIPGLNESDIAVLLERAKECGASNAFMTLLRLPREVKDVFVERLEDALPEKSKKVLNKLRAMRGGELSQSRFGKRMSGEGPEWKAARALFELRCKQLGITAAGGESPEREAGGNRNSTFTRPGEGKQLRLI